MWRKEIWAKQWSRLQVLLLVLIVLLALSMLDIPKWIYILRGL